MVLRPNNWETPKYCRHMTLMFNGEKMNNVPCFMDRCPKDVWIPPKRIRSEDNKNVTWTKGSCSLDTVSHS